MPERIDQLNEGLRKLADATHEVSTEVARSVQVELDKDRARYRWWLIGIVVLLLPSLIAAVTSTILLLQSRERSMQNRAVLDQITDCTTPGRPCYVQSQKRTAAVLGQVEDSEMAVAECVRAGATDAAMESCVHDRMEVAK